MTDPLTEAERLHMTNLREAWRIAAPVYTDLAATDVEWLCTIIDRLSAAPVDDRERVPEPWVTYGPTGRRYRVNVDLLSDGDRMPEWLTADPVSPSVDPEEG